jgi:hypothetical protein
LGAADWHHKLHVRCSCRGLMTGKQLSDPRERGLGALLNGHAQT